MLNGNTDLLQPDPGSRVKRMALRGTEWTSVMLKWVEPKGKVALVLVRLLNILRSASGQKRISDTQKFIHHIEKQKKDRTGNYPIKQNTPD